MYTDPLFFLVAVPAVLIGGMAKGGLGNILGTACVPLMALVLPPVQAAAILLPLLLVMDLISLWKFRGQVDSRTLFTVFPGCIAGVALAALLFGYLSEQYIRLMIGVVSLSFCLMQWLKNSQQNIRKASYIRGSFWGAIGGFTSFGIHAGGPPISIYTLPLGLNSHKLMGTQAWMFAGMNMAKVVVYGSSGQLDTQNLSASLILLPLTPLGVIAGYKILSCVSEKVVYRVSYGFLGSIGFLLFLQGSGLIPTV
ncbi:sulfite exporter TauE/SafE family protein [Sansalvadorimonas verongulae]|uniref:sulfite exporter TauE/SafE family protein n=1 Tax=Sansalvadorimonas verongulae TaxID=2172824 RepID=UPI0012BC1CC2|nr:sulfite exporter TauE/SafE family protein [Sansalvadorimonas verongulae]MTI14003.1 sulfite exporter TauE/SafE family protein [Sansalvadorimonas verongulae]